MHLQDDRVMMKNKFVVNCCDIYCGNNIRFG